MTIYIRYQRNIGNISKFDDWLGKVDVWKWIYLGTDSGWRADVEKQIISGLGRVRIADELEDVSRKYRQEYIDAIGSLSQANDSFEWWASDIAAKDPFTGLFSKVCLSEVVNHLDMKGNVCVVGSTPAICRTVQSNLSAYECDVNISEPRELPTREIARALPIIPGLWRVSKDYKKYVETRPDYRIRALKGKKIEPFTGTLFFTWVDKRSIVDGKYSDPHFGILPTRMKSKGINVAFAPRILPGTEFEPMVDSLLSSGERMYIPEMFMREDHMKRCKEVARYFSPKIQDTFVGKTNIADLVKEQVDIARMWHVDSLMYRSMIEGMRRHNVIPSVVYYGCEGQRWENSLVHSLRHYIPQTRIIAYDNTMYSKMTCALFPSAKEYWIRPFPDVLITQGQMFADTLKSCGYPEERIYAGCGLRPSSYSPIERRDMTKTNGNILVATSIGIDESVELISKVLTSLGGYSRYHINIKAHPVLDLSIVRRLVGHVMDYDNVTVSEKPISELLKESDMVFYAFTTVCIDALRYGVIPIYVRGENRVNLDKLDSAQYVRHEVTTQEDILQVVRDISLMTIEERQMWYNAALDEYDRAMTTISDDCVDRLINI